MSDYPDILPDLTDKDLSKLEIAITKALKIRSSIPVHDVFIVTQNQGCWSNEITINLPADLIDHLIKTHNS